MKLQAAKRDCWQRNHIPANVSGQENQEQEIGALGQKKKNNKSGENSIKCEDSGKADPDKTKIENVLC